MDLTRLRFHEERLHADKAGNKKHRGRHLFGWISGLTFQLTVPIGAYGAGGIAV
jgi:hypothetical protein